MWFTNLLDSGPNETLASAAAQLTIAAIAFFANRTVTVLGRFWIEKREPVLYCTVQYCNVEPVFGGLWARNVSIGRRAVVTRRGDMKSYSQYETH